jgi:NAD+ synthase
MMSEKDSSDDSIVCAREVANHLGVETVAEDMTGAVVGFGCYSRRDKASQHVLPGYDPGHKAKMTLPGNVLESDTPNLFYLTIISPEAKERSERLDLRDYLQIVAAPNLKQRSRITILYYHAELRNYAVIGTPNKNEPDQGFFVKWGNGGYDVAPIRHLYKTQVCQLAEYLGVPAEIREATPTTDTYSAPSSQEEFFFRLPFDVVDLPWYALERDVPVTETTQVMGLTEEQMQRAFADLVRKRGTTQYLRTLPIEYGQSRNG